MLSFFPSLLPDETLYSGWARYGERLGLSSVRILSPLLFGKVVTTARFYMESRVDCFASNFPKGHPYNSCEYILQNHTLFPLHSPTWFENRAKAISGVMTGTLFKKRTILCNQTHGIYPNKYARFCPVCRDEDVFSYGEPYWHRLHQIPEIAICAKHKCLLENSTLTITWPDVTSFLHFVSARQVISSSLRPRTFSREDGEYKRLQLLFAKNAKYVLARPSHVIDLEKTVRMFVQVLCPRKGFSVAYLNLPTSGLANQIRSRYSEELLARLNIKISPIRLSMMFHNRTPPSPVALFLLMDFFGVKINSLRK